MILQRIRDALRERRIRRFAAALKLANAAGQSALAHTHWEGLRRECLARSAAQVARMERGRGLSRALKVSLVAGYCHHILPAWFLKPLFSVFRLGAV